MLVNKSRWGVLASAALVMVLMSAVSVSLAQSGSKTKPKDGEKPAHSVKAELNAQALMALKGAKVPMVLLDARGPSAEWIDGAMPMAYDADEKTAKRSLAKREQLIVTYCGGPECPMSQMLADRLAGYGYTKVIRFTGGVAAWTEAGYELKKAKDKPGKGSGSRKGSGSK